MDTRPTSIIKDALNILYNESQELLYPIEEVQTIDYMTIIDKPTWALEFQRDYVSRNIPVLIKGGCNNFNAINTWNSDYFLKHLRNKQVKVAITPNGYADGINTIDETDYFFLPQEESMSMQVFLKSLSDRLPNYVCYIQEQNSNFEKYPELKDDIPNDIDWATAAFNKLPDAVNFWMGDERAITSMHKDPYENIYCVIDGYKDFILIPAMDLPYITYKNYPVRMYNNVSPLRYDIENDPISTYPNGMINWIANNPLDPHCYEKHKKFKKARRFNVRVEKGDILYLPSLWFHHVRQSHGCIAANYWYDIEYSSPLYCYYQMLQKLCELKN